MTTKFYDLWAAPEPAPPTRPAAPPGPETERYAVRALEDELYALSITPEGQRNHQLNKAAFNLAQLVHGGYLDHDNTWRSLASTARMIGLDSHETRATIASAFRSAPPRHVAEREPLPDATVYTPPDAEEDATPLLDRHLLDWQELWDADDEEEWIIEPILPARRLVALFSAPKVGKSLLMLELAVAIARGEPVLDTTIDRARRVAYVDYENDPRGDVRTRLVAMGRKPDELENLRYLSFPSMPGLDTRAGASHLLDFCARHEVEVVVIDTVSRAVDGEENENDTWLSFYKRTGLAMKQNGIACIRLDHTGKDATKGMRGGSAKYGDVDAVWSMTAISDTTFRLECTANRMPVGEKLLVLRRELLPHLHHAVDGSGVRAIGAAREQQLVAQLYELYGDGDAPDSVKTVMGKLKERFGKAADYYKVQAAMEERERELLANRLTYGVDS